MQQERILQGDLPIIGKNIKSLREKKQMRNKDVVTNVQLAGIALSASTLSKIERGTCNPTTQLLFELTNIFQCDFNSFFENSKE